MAERGVAAGGVAWRGVAERRRGVAERAALRGVRRGMRRRAAWRGVAWCGVRVAGGAHVAMHRRRAPQPARTTKRAPPAAAQAGECARATARIAAAARGLGALGPSQHICPRRRFCLMPAACKQQNDERRPQRRLASACGRRRESPQQRAGVGPTDGPSLHSPVVDGDRSKSWRLTKRNA